MAMSLNQVTLIGNLGKDPETRTFSNGNGVTSLTLALSEKYKKDGEWVDKTEWVNVSVFNENAQKLCGYLSKGNAVFVQGKLQTRKWTDKDGNDKFTTEVVVSPFDGKILLLEKGEKREPQSETRKSETRKPARATREWEDVGLDDEMPF